MLETSLSRLSSRLPLSTSTSAALALTVAATAATCAILASSALYATTHTYSLERHKSSKTSTTRRPRLVRMSASIRAYLTYCGFPKVVDLDSPDSEADTRTESSSTGPTEATSGCCEEDVDDGEDVEFYSGLLIGDDLFDAVKSCKERVARISRECRADNRRFRDIEFDILDARDLCLHNLTKTHTYTPTDIRRVTELYEEPRLFVDGPSPNDIQQGALGDCWLLSALSALSTVDGLIPKLCVARDEEVGVYAFIFRKHGKWVPVIIDDLLYTDIPKFDFLEHREKLIYKNDRDVYNAIARKGGEGLYFAKSGRDGETWVPLIEKAYAKLYGDFGSVHGGWTSDALEDLTGGVTESWKGKDILDTDRWWTEELSKAGQDRFFDVGFPELSTVWSNGEKEGDHIEGLVSGHAYSVLRAKEIQGRRFVVVRNPWALIEWKWKGRWSDGSKEWTPETLPILKELGHSMGDKASFVMEYSDFLGCFENIQRTVLFDHTWRMSQCWLSVPPKPDGYPWSYGEVVFHFTLAKPSKTHIVLSQVDRRSFEPISGRIYYYLDFVVHKRGETESRGVSVVPFPRSCRNVCCALDLEEGEYLVFPRVERQFFEIRSLGYYKDAVESWDKRKLSRVLTQRAQAVSTAQNADMEQLQKHLPRDYDTPLLPLESIGEGEGPLANGPDSSVPAGNASTSEEEKPPPAQCTLEELSKEPEDRELLVLGLQVYAQRGCIAEVSGTIPLEADVEYPIAAN